MFRVGFESLTTESSTQGKTGLAVFDVASDQMTWTGSNSLSPDSSDLPLPSGLGWYITLSNQNGTFYSLALDSSSYLSLVTWSIGGSATATALGLSLPPYFGPPARNHPTDAQKLSQKVVSPSLQVLLPPNDKSMILGKQPLTVGQWAWLNPTNWSSLSHLGLGILSLTPSPASVFQPSSRQGRLMGQDLRTPIPPKLHLISF